MAEHSAVNRRVVGSSPTCGARLKKGRWKNLAGLFFLTGAIGTAKGIDPGSARWFSCAEPGLLFLRGGLTKTIYLTLVVGRDA